ncbi:MAG TPA: helix-turn-helix transcriptional regulator [Thermoanaerobaculia bacterium]|jgi:transcriptional regulator with XRE-family HTH domain
MRREHIMARLLRAISGKTQQRFGEETGIDPSVIADFELGNALPSRDHLERMAAAVRLTVSSTEEALRALDTLRRPRQRRGEGAQPILEGIVEGVRSEVEEAYRRLLTLRLPDAVSQAEERLWNGERLAGLEGFPALRRE